LHRETFEVRKRVLGKDHPDTLASKQMLEKCEARAAEGGTSNRLDDNWEKSFPIGDVRPNPIRMNRRVSFNPIIDLALSLFTE
jgi:hypothetical protein